MATNKLQVFRRNPRHLQDPNVQIGTEILVMEIVLIENIASV